MRTSTGIALVAPTGSTSRSWIARSSLAWSASGSSAISSSSKVPPSAARNRPSLAPPAPVKLPFWWPNSIASSIVSGSAAQLIATNGASRRGDLLGTVAGVSIPGRERADA